jgi:transposase
MAETRRFDSGDYTWRLEVAKQARNKAVVAVARKLAVLLHRIWITQEPSTQKLLEE